MYSIQCLPSPLGKNKEATSLLMADGFVDEL